LLSEFALSSPIPSPDGNLSGFFFKQPKKIYIFAVMDRVKQIEQIYRICNDIHQKSDYSYYIGYNSERFIEIMVHPVGDHMNTLFERVVYFNEGIPEDNLKIVIDDLLKFKRNE
jgi:hypothetical protein